MRPMAEGRPLAEQLGIDADRPDSFAFVANGQAHVNYDLVARNRYRWFGRRDACILPNSDRSWPS
jgi:predicted DCC family thiol-disulfide oxidoreductase YuxK